MVRESTKPTRILKWTFIILFLLIGVIGAGHGEVDDDDQLYNQIVAIKGNVQILNHPDLGLTPASRIYLVFQREDCKRCLVATWTDSKGDYEIFVGQGKYRIIVRNPSPPTYDMLAPEQPRYVNATKDEKPKHFDIKLVLSAK